MPMAFVLINAEIGSEDQVVKELKSVPQVKEAYMVYGVYDIVAKVSADTMDKLKEIITWKVIGNGALSLHFSLKEEQLNEVKKIAVSVVERTTDASQRSTDPGIVFLKGPVPSSLGDFSVRALHDILSVREARNVADAV